MSTAFSIALSSRALEIVYIAERHHRAFDEEIALLQDLVGAPGEGIPAALTKLARALAEHEREQERIWFCVYNDEGSFCPHADAYARDALRLFGAVDRLRAAAHVSDVDGGLLAIEGRLLRSRA